MQTPNTEECEHGRQTAGANVRRQKGNNPDRLLFATDTMRYTMTPENVSIIPYFKRILDDGLISGTAHHKISHGNAAQLLGLA